MSANGDVLAESRGNEGMLHCAPARDLRPSCAITLRNSVLPNKSTLVLICGMAGRARAGSRAPYLHTPTRLDALHEGAVRVDGWQ